MDESSARMKLGMACDASTLLIPAGPSWTEYRCTCMPPAPDDPRSRTAVPCEPTTAISAPGSVKIPPDPTLPDAAAFVPTFMEIQDFPGTTDPTNGPRL